MHRGRGPSIALCVGAALFLTACSQSQGTTSTTSPPTTTVVTTTSTATTTSLPASSTTSSTASSTTTVGVTSCVRSGVTIKTGKSSGAAGTIALGFIVTNSSSATCTLQGFPGITLLPKSGTLNPAVSHTGSAPLVTIAPAGEAGFVLNYSDVPVNGETTCPSVIGVGVALPQVAGAAIEVSTQFRPCGQPELTVSGVLSLQQYKARIR